MGGPRDVAVHPAQPGQRVAHYEIIQELGRGGMGVVYRARDLNLRRQVALKCPWPAAVADARRRKQFMREARASSRLSHPNVVPIFEVLEDNGTPWLAMELVDGTSLRTLVGSGKPLPVPEIVSHAEGVASALQTAHERDIVHGDVTPNNVLVAADGRALLADFGLARFTAVAEDFSTESRQSDGDAGPGGGTLRYMSPEQALGRPLDPRSDIFSLGTVLYEMCTGQPAFAGVGTGDVIDAILHREPTAISRLNYEVPETLERIVRKALAKQPEQRYQHVRELRVDLQAVRQALGHGRFPGPTAPPRRSIHRWAWPLVAALVLAAGVGTALRQAPGGKESLEPQRMRLGVMAPQDLANRPETTNWPALIQTLFVTELTGIDEIAIVDPLSLNGLVESSLGSGQPQRTPRLYEVLQAAQLVLLIDGAVTAVRDGFQIQSNLVNAATGELHSSHRLVVSGEDALPAAVAKLAGQILTALQVKVLATGRDKDLRPWLSHRANLEALKAFMQARQNIYRNKSGIEHLRRAVELDPTFISARVWLISGLGLTERLAEAQEHYRVLERLEPSASPFDQAMIGWAGAYLARDRAAQARQLEIALEYSPGNNILLFTLADARLWLGQYEECLRAVEPAIRMQWRYPQLYALRGACQAGLGQFETAKQSLEESLAISPVHPDVYGLLAALWQRDGVASKSERYEQLYRERSQQVGIARRRMLEKLSGHFKRAGLADRAAALLDEAALGEPSPTPPTRR